MFCHMVWFCLVCYCCKYTVIVDSLGLLVVAQSVSVAVISHNLCPLWPVAVHCGNLVIPG